MALRIFDPKAPREAIWEDLDVDTANRRKLMVARYLVGLMLNQLRGVRPLLAPVINDLDLADQAEKVGRLFGIIAPPDELHHAPACPANLWSGMHIPSAPCNCGAAYDEAKRLKQIAKGAA